MNSVSVPLQDDDEIRAVFFSYLELNKYIKNKTEDESKFNIKTVISNMKQNKFNTLILHVRPFSDAIYKSSIFLMSDTVKVDGKTQIIVDKPKTKKSIRVIPLPNQLVKLLKIIEFILLV